MQEVVQSSTNDEVDQGEEMQQKRNNEHQYFSLIQEKQKKFTFKNLDENTVSQYRIQTIENDDKADYLRCYYLLRHGNVFIDLRENRENGMDCMFDVLIGGFYMKIRVLNLHRRSEENQLYSLEKIGEGSFGIVKKAKIGSKNMAIKRILFFSAKNQGEKERVFLSNLINKDDSMNPDSLRNAIKQYCIYKICSLLGIGPKLIFLDTFDLICYNDCIEFYMELCQPSHINLNYDKFERQIQDCLSTLHSHKIIHKDIKVSNTLYSPSKGGYVLSDFGLANSVEEDVNEKTMTKFQGSKIYASEEMLELQNKGKGLVNLYKNDYHCLLKALQECREEFNRSNSYQNNSMSYVKNSLHSRNSVSFSSEPQQNEPKLQQQSTSASYQQNQYSLHIKQFHVEYINQKINFYQMKILSHLLKQQQKITLARIQEKVLQICVGENDMFVKFIMKALECLLLRKNNYENDITCFQNAIRIFGFYSEQVLEQFKKIRYKKNIPFLNYSIIEKTVEQLTSKRKQYFLKSHQSFIEDVIRQEILKNRTSYIKNLKYLKYYISEGYNFKQYTVFFICGIFTAYIFGDLSKQQYKELINVLKIMIIRSEFFEISQEQLNEMNSFTFWSFIYEELKRKQQLNSYLYEIFMIFFLNENQEKADQLFNQILKIIENLQSISHEFKENDFQIRIAPYRICCLNYFQTKKWQVTLLEYFEANFKCLANCTKYQTQIRMELLPAVITALFKRKNQSEISDSQIEQLMEEYFVLNKKINFNTVKGRDFVYHYFFKANLQLKKQNFTEALQYFKLSFECYTNSVVEERFISNKIWLLINMSMCFKKMGNFEEQLKCLKQAYLIKENKQIFRKQMVLDIYYFIVKSFLNQKIVNRELQQYLREYLIEGVKLAYKIWQNKFKQVKNMPIFVFESFQEILLLSQQQLITFKKIIVSQIEQSLPLFILQYQIICEQLSAYFHKKGCKELSIFYLYKIVINYRKQTLGSKQCQNILLFIQKMLKYSSDERYLKRALQILKKYIYYFPQKEQKLQSKAYCKLKKISQKLKTKQSNFYDFVCKEKAYESYHNFKKAKKIMKTQLPLSFEIKIWRKKMKQIFPDNQNRNHKKKQ